MLRFTSTTQSFCEVHRALCSIHFLRCACRCPSFLSLSHLFTRFLMEIGKITLPEVRMKKPAINHWWAKCNYRSSACESFRWYNSRYWLTISTMKPLIHIQLSQLIFQEFAYILCTGLSQERAVAQKPKTFRIATYAQKLFGRSFTFCCSFSSLNLSMPSTQFIIWHFLTSQINLHLFILFSGSIDHQGWVMFKLTPEFNHACLPPPLPLVLLSASLNCFNLAQSAVGYGQWHLVLNSFCARKFENSKAYLLVRKKKYFAKIFDRVLSEEWVGLQRWSFHNNSHSELVSVYGSFVFLGLNILNFFSGFQVLELTPRSLVGQNSSLQVLRRLL